MVWCRLLEPESSRIVMEYKGMALYLAINAIQKTYVIQDERNQNAFNVVARLEPPKLRSSTSRT